MNIAEVKDLAILILAGLSGMLSVVAIIRVTILGGSKTEIIYCHDPKDAAKNFEEFDKRHEEMMKRADEMFKRGDELFEQAFKDMKL